jgi:hypothetical protein
VPLVTARLFEIIYRLWALVHMYRHHQYHNTTHHYHYHCLYNKSKEITKALIFGRMLTQIQHNSQFYIIP